MFFWGGWWGLWLSVILHVVNLLYVFGFSLVFLSVFSPAIIYIYMYINSLYFENCRFLKSFLGFVDAVFFVVNDFRASFGIYQSF